MLAMWEEMGRMLSWSSMTRHFLQDARERINLRNKTMVVRCRGGRQCYARGEKSLFFRKITGPPMSQKARRELGSSEMIQSILYKAPEHILYGNQENPRSQRHSHDCSCQVIWPFPHYLGPFSTLTPKSPEVPYGHGSHRETHTETHTYTNEFSLCHK